MTRRDNWASLNARLKRAGDGWMARNADEKPTTRTMRATALVLAAALPTAVGLGANMAQAQPAACPYVSDGVCDEPGIGTGACPAGTDVVDCGTTAPPDLAVPEPPQAGVCLYMNDGVCDEPGIGTGACPAGTDTADCGTTEPPPDLPPPDLDGPRTVLLCPTDLIGSAPGEEIMCDCDPWALETGLVWGSGPYTADSNLCRAALHAGAIPETGGSVTVRVGQGCDYYAPSTANSIDALIWRTYPASFHFPGVGDGICAEPPPPPAVAEPVEAGSTAVETTEPAEEPAEEPAAFELLDDTSEGEADAAVEAGASEGDAPVELEAPDVDPTEAGEPVPAAIAAPEAAEPDAVDEATDSGPDDQN